MHSFRHLGSHAFHMCSRPLKQILCWAWAHQGFAAWFRRQHLVCSRLSVIAQHDDQQHVAACRHCSLSRDIARCLTGLL